LEDLRFCKKGTHILELLLMQGRCTSRRQNIDAIPVREHANQVFFVVVLKIAHHHMTSGDLTTLAVLKWPQLPHY